MEFLFHSYKHAEFNGLETHCKTKPDIYFMNTYGK